MAEQKQVVITLSWEQYQRFEKLVASDISVMREQHEPAHLGFQLGIQFALRKLREGFVAGG